MHRYYYPRRLMNLPDIHFYDTYVPILTDIKVNRNCDEGVEVVIDSLKPLRKYIDVLPKAAGRWCDRYRTGKHSGPSPAAATTAIRLS